MIVMLLVALLAACGAQPTAVPTVETTPVPTSQPEPMLTAAPTTAPAAYPAPSQSEIPAYPEPSGVTEAYPPPSGTGEVGPEGPEFTITTPLLVGDMLIEGTGPAGVPIRVIDITFLGQTLGTGTIDQDGAFSVRLGVALEAGHSIGIQLGDLAGTNLNARDFVRGPGYQDIPQIGTIFVQATVDRP